MLICDSSHKMRNLLTGCRRKLSHQRVTRKRRVHLASTPTERVVSKFLLENSILFSNYCTLLIFVSFVLLYQGQQCRALNFFCGVLFSYLIFNLSVWFDLYLLDIAAENKAHFSSSPCDRWWKIGFSLIFYHRS